MKAIIQKILPYWGETAYSIEPGHGFQAYGPLHLAWLATAVFVFVGFFFLFKKWDDKAKHRAIVIVGILTVLDELGKYLFTGIWGTFRVDYLPLHICSINIILIGIDLIKPNKYLEEILYVMSIPGAACALCFPTWSNLPITSYMHIHSFTVHTLLVLYPLLLLYSGFRPTWQRGKKTIPYCLAVMGAVFIFNKIFHTSFMFLNGAEPGTPLVWAEKVLGNPGYILVFIAIICFDWAVMYGIVAKLINRRQTSVNKAFV